MDIKINDICLGGGMVYTVHNAHASSNLAPATIFKRLLRGGLSLMVKLRIVAPMMTVQLR